MNRKAVYEKVRKHLLAQGRRAIRGETTADDNLPVDCLYRAPNGDRCAFGCLIPDELYDQRMEGRSAEAVCHTFPALAKHLGLRDEEDVEFLFRLQKIHDVQPPETWAEVLDQFAAEWGLDV